MILCEALSDPGKVYSINLSESLRDAANRALCPGYRFYNYAGNVAVGASLPAKAVNMDQVSTSPVTVGLDGFLKATAVDGTVVTLAMQGKSAYELWLAMGNTGTQAEYQAALKGVAGKDGNPQRLEAYVSGPCNSSGVVVVTFSKPFTIMPTVFPTITWLANQMVTAYPTAVALDKVTLLVKRSKGTLLLTDGPFETAPAGVVTTIVAMGS